MESLLVTWTVSTALCKKEFLPSSSEPEIKYPKTWKTIQDSKTGDLLAEFSMHKFVKYLDEISFPRTAIGQ